MEQSSCSVSELVGGVEPVLLHGDAESELFHGGGVLDLLHGDGLRRELTLCTGMGRKLLLGLGLGGGRKLPRGTGTGSKLLLGLGLGGGRRQGVGTGGGLELPPFNPDKSSLLRARKSWASMQGGIGRNPALSPSMMSPRSSTDLADP